jgi:hypothetical protein
MDVEAHRTLTVQLAYMMYAKPEFAAKCGIQENSIVEIGVDDRLYLNVSIWLGGPFSKGCSIIVLICTTGKVAQF